MYPSPSCLPPLPVFGEVDFIVPPGACDTHAHVIGDDAERHPLIEDRSYTAPPAVESAYIAMLDNLGLQRGVLVQISTYGTDNRCMLETLRRHPDRLRGISVVDQDCPQAELETLHAAGVRGVRINTLLRGGVGYGQVEKLAERIAPLGWHMQFLMHARDLPDLMPLMRRLPVPGVVDHMGDLRPQDDLHSAGLDALCILMRDHGWWAKLSGAYRMGLPADRLEDSTPLARRLIEAAPDRVLWGSDWPHVNLHQDMPDTAALLNLLARWAPDEALRRRILVDNPGRLYWGEGVPAG
ncbi:amidohydrolase family protein [Xylophilus sp. GOD-11R]|uniref:amidohydrolase family protein n=1 Tax=Xylophilus sp. GOD-11R TaxID=3089814 RepID=UPI00298C0441|nr:amidohydrolase family protein [Xylophilus sp. GOD-11R]WPB55660.1 amidohydrolase family protein [Xylophilus sp. GOD-11R]